MSIIEHTLNSDYPDHFTPRVSTENFTGHAEASFWLGVVATEEDVLYEQEYAAASVLRANTYIDKHNFLTAASRNEFGGETDENDDRSVHFVAVQNTNTEGQGKLVGNLRAIRKREEGDLLPVELFFPEAFEDIAAPINSVEASRFISSHEDKFTRGAISLALIRAVVMRAYVSLQEPIYAVVEEPLARRFAKVGLPFDRLGDPKPLAEYNNTENMALRFMPSEIVAAAEKDVSAETLIGAFFASATKNLGIGYYDNLLLNPIEN